MSCTWIPMVRLFHDKPQCTGLFKKVARPTWKWRKWQEQTCTIILVSVCRLQTSRLPTCILPTERILSEKTQTKHVAFTLSRLVFQFSQKFLYYISQGAQWSQICNHTGMHQFLVIRYRQNVWTKNSIKEQSREIVTIILIVPQFGISTGLQPKDILFRAETKHLSQLRCSPTSHNWWLPWALSLEVRRPGRDADHPRPSWMRTSADLLAASSLCRGA